MDYGNVLSRAWQIIWKHKVLWIFGILAGCNSGGGGGGSNLRYSSEEEAPQWMQPLVQQFDSMPDGQIALLVGALILVMLVLVIVAIFLGTIGRVGLVRGTQQAEGGAASLSFGELFSGSMPYFWRVFGLNLVVGLAIFAFVVVFALIGLFGAIATLGLGLVCLIPLACVMVPVLWFVSVIVEQASIAIILENLSLMDGLRRGWDVVRNNLGAMIIMALILGLGVGGIGGMLIALPVVFIFIPAAFGGAIGGSDALGNGLLVAGICFVAYLPILLVLNGILRSFIESAWTLTFLRLTAKPMEIVAPSEAV